MEEKRNVYAVVLEKPFRKRPYERPRNRWENNMKVDIK
jgi:hypothetical protein